MHQTRQIFFPCNITNEVGHRVKQQAPTLNSRPQSHYTFPQPTSPKSPVNFVQYHRRYRQEYPIEVDYRFPPVTSRSRTRQDRNFRSLDFELGLREDNASSYSEAPPYHQYPEEDWWEDQDRGRRREREYSKADDEVAHGTISEDTPQPPIAMFEARPRRGEGVHPPLQPAMNLHPYVRALASVYGNLKSNFHNRRSPLSLLLSVSHLKSNQHDRF